jgi:hypothetical protein
MIGRRWLGNTLHHRYNLGRPREPFWGRKLAALRIGRRELEMQVDEKDWAFETF